MTGWQLNPNSSDNWESEEYRIEDGTFVATLESFGDRFYPHALTPEGEWRRGGCFFDLPAAKAWAEKMAGIRPKTPGMCEGGASSPFAS